MPNQNRVVSVGGKLAVTTIALVLLAAAGIYFKLSRYQQENLLRSREAGTSALTRLFADSCAAAVVFDDAEAIKDRMATLARNEYIEYAAIWGVSESGKITQRLGELRRGPVAAVTHVPRQMEIERHPDRVVLFAPVSDQNAKVVAVAVVGFSLASDNKAIADVERGTLIVSIALAFGLSVLLMVMARFGIVRPLRKLVFAAKQLEEGGDGHELDIHTNDEIGQLARAFRSMATAIRVREERLNARNRDMRLVLDNVGQGFITLDKRGAMSEERSRVIDEWFGDAGGSPTFWDYLARIDPAVAQWFQLGWEAIGEDVLPLAMCLDQLPRRLCKDGRTFELAYRPIMTGDRSGGTIVVITDLTAAIRSQRAEQKQREMMSIFRFLLSDRTAFETFFSEAGAMVDAIARSNGSDLNLLRRQVHTLKGNCALFGIESIAVLCHELEERMDASAEAISVEGKSGLRDLWATVGEMRAQLTERGSEGRVELDHGDYQGFLADLRARAPYESLIATASSWELDPAAKRLALVGQQVQALAKRLGKAAVDVVYEPTSLRLPIGKWAPFWSILTHVVRNTVDHGVNTTSERVESGKPPRATITLSLAAEGPDVVLMVRDDGRGINWKKIAERARQCGLPCASPADIEEALFREGVSSRSDVTTTSGRGIGLAAVREVVRQLGGRIELTSTAGRGTVFRFILPRTLLLGDPPAAGADDRSTPLSLAARETALAAGDGSPRARMS